MLNNIQYKCPIYYCVLDFEATCWDLMIGHRHEFIEFPSILWKYDGDNFALIDQFREFVLPIQNPIISQFCINLTGITQNQVNTGDSLENVLTRHRKQLYSCINDESNSDSDSNPQIIIVTVGNWDIKHCLDNEAQYLNIKLFTIYKMG